MNRRMDHVLWWMTTSNVRSVEGVPDGLRVQPGRCHDGEQGLTSDHHRVPALWGLEVMLPGINGFEVLAADTSGRRFHAAGNGARRGRGSHRGLEIGDRRLSSEAV